jgi:hypothetical protein
MRKTLFLTAVAIAIAFTTSAQTKTDRAEVKWGPELNDKEDGNFQTVMETTDEAMYMWMNRKKEQLIQKMDLDLHRIYQKPLDEGMLEDERGLEKILLMKDKVIVFTSRYDKKTDRNELYARPYSESDYSPLAARKTIATIPAEKEKNAGEFEVSFTPDEKAIRVRITEPRVKKEETRTRTMFLDFELDETSGDAFAEGIKHEIPDDFTIDDRLDMSDGATIYVGRKYPEKRERKELRRQEKPDHTFYLLVFDRGSSAPREHKIDVNEKFLQDLTFQEDTDGDIICGGFYGNKGSWSIRGVFFLSLDKNSKAVTHESYKEFSDDFITEGMSEKEERKAEKKAKRKDEDLELPNYKLDKIIRKKDGGAVMIAEQYRSYTVCTTDSRGNTRCSTHYLYNDIIVVNVDAQGNIEWASKVVKRQHTVNDGGYYSSYATHVKDDQIYLIFNDNGENLFLPKGERVKQFELKGDDAIVTLATIDGDGTVHREALFTQERKGAIFKPSDCRSFPGDRMFLYATRRSEYRFGVITFK